MRMAKANFEFRSLHLAALQKIEFKRASTKARSREGLKSDRKDLGRHKDEPVGLCK